MGIEAGFREPQGSSSWLVLEPGAVVQGPTVIGAVSGSDTSPGIVDGSRCLHFGAR